MRVEEEWKGRKGREENMGNRMAEMKDREGEQVRSYLD